MSDLPTSSLGLTTNDEQLAAEEARLARNMSHHSIGERGKAFLAGQAPAPANPTASPAKVPRGTAESWVDLHREYGDILDATELQTYRKHFQAFGNTDGFITVNDLRNTMVTFFGQEDITIQQVEESIAEVDYDQDGSISYREFLEVMCAIKSGDRNRRTKFGNFYKVITVKNPPFWAQRVNRLGH